MDNRNKVADIIIASYGDRLLTFHNNIIKSWVLLFNDKEIYILLNIFFKISLFRVGIATKFCEKNFNPDYSLEFYKWISIASEKDILQLLYRLKKSDLTYIDLYKNVYNRRQKTIKSKKKLKNGITTAGPLLIQIMPKEIVYNIMYYIGSHQYFI